MMSRYRTSIGFTRLEKLKYVLASREILIEYKKSVLNGLLLPTVMFGSEIFGMSEVRAKSAK
jgi:hypothetical protein